MKSEFGITINILIDLNFPSILISEGFMSLTNPLDWQKHVNLLASLRHGQANYQVVPDKHKGDLGIEGFSPDDGVCYQAYCPEEPISTEERYLKQRGKITSDIKKFINNESELEKLFGNTKIKKWVLVVPILDSRILVQHGAIKAQEVLNKNLSYVDNDFKIVIETEEQFTEQKFILLNNGLSKLDLEPIEASLKNIQDWSKKITSL